MSDIGFFICLGILFYGLGFISWQVMKSDSMYNNWSWKQRMKELNKEFSDSRGGKN